LVTNREEVYVFDSRSVAEHPDISCPKFLLEGEEIRKVIIMWTNEDRKSSRILAGA